MNIQDYIGARGIPEPQEEEVRGVLKAKSLGVEGNIGPGTGPQGVKLDDIDIRGIPEPGYPNEFIATYDPEFEQVGGVPGDLDLCFNWFRGEVKRVVDGDTVDGKIFLGFNVTIEVRFRLSKVDAPEPRGAEKDAGLAAKDYLMGLLPEGQEILIEVKNKKSFDRHVVDLYVFGQNVSKLLVESSHAEVL